MTEVFDLLKNVILVNLKIVFAKTGNKRIATVENGCAQDNEIGVDSERIVVA
jgi:hypothetical protein